MEEFVAVHEVKPETKYHYKKEILEMNKAEIAANKDIWMNNYCANAALINKSRNVDILYKDPKWQNQECLIVGAGPTLDLDIENIKKHKQKVVIICTDSALNPLMKNGIKPNFVFTQNTQESVLDLFSGFPTKDLKVVANVFQPPELFAKIKSELYFYAPFEDETVLNNFVQLTPHIPKILKKPSTLVMAYIFARCMKFRTIYLLGADFCFETPEKVYCNDVLYKNNSFKGDIVTPEDIFLEKTKTYRELFYSAEDLFRMIVMESPDSTFNCSQNSILYNVNWLFFDEIMKRQATTKSNVFEFAQVLSPIGDEDVMRMNELTLNYFKAQISRSMLKNVGRYVKERNVGEWLNRHEDFKDKYCVVCGAGPSLQDNIELLKKYRDRFTVFGVDASLMPLYKAGIEPDAILTIDPCNLSRFFHDYHGNHTALFASVHTHYKAIEAWKNKIYFYYPTPMKRHQLWMLALIKEYSNLPFILPFNNCGSTMILFAHEMGFKEIAIMGIDFSYTGDKMYANNAVSESIIGFGEKVDNKEKIEKHLNKYGLQKVINCKGETVYSDAPFLIYAKTLENLINSRKMTNIINVGTSILKIPYMPFDQYVKRFDS
ncbi:MAG: hypothetical protein BWY32_03200 [bacterium ADurb.Bin243]|nr:MAG: hypothetical protein BWY32_03200 [bacterium ADurb.Bin243]HOD39972.1 DUF115 domain-containing protein [Candidatus Wallbacteria bacterium]